MNNLSFGNQDYQYYETICGGSGAGKGFTGADAVQTHMTNSRLTDPEILESRFPVRLVSFALRVNSGGQGKWVGGCGVVRELHFLQSMQVSILSSHRQIAPYGLCGGESGQTGCNQLCRFGKKWQIVPATIALNLIKGDYLRISTSSGGGYGKLSNQSLSI